MNEIQKDIFKFRGCETDLEHYLLFDFWKASDGIAILVGYSDPYAKYRAYCGEALPDDEILFLDDYCAKRYARYCEMWTQSKLDIRSVRDPMAMSHSNVLELEFPPRYFIEWALSKKLAIDWLYWATERGLYTPTLEAAQPAQIAATPAYSTSWMSIQQAAINEFFNPRRNPDAKKEEVVEWIKSAALAAGLPDSQNVASTIFTIIKPENHDPKKKRVEPQ
jgi:hypothetical protein